MKNTFKKIIAVISSAAILMANSATFSVSAEDSEYGSVTITVYDADTGEFFAEDVKAMIYVYNDTTSSRIAYWSTAEQNPFTMSDIIYESDVFYRIEMNPLIYKYKIVSDKSQVEFNFNDSLEQNIEIYLKGGVGDANSDGKVNAMDATYIARYSAGLISLSDESLFLSDVNNDGKVNAMDATHVARWMIWT